MGSLVVCKSWGEGARGRQAAWWWCGCLRCKVLGLVIRPIAKEVKVKS